MSASSRRVSRQVPAEPKHHWRMAAGVAASLALVLGWLLGVLSGTEPARTRVSLREDGTDGGAVAVGDSALAEPRPSLTSLSAWSTIAVDVPAEPVEGQQRPDANGRCPRKGQVAFQGACWLKLGLTRSDCEGNGYVYKDKACYAPAFPTRRPATSGPAD